MPYPAPEAMPPEVPSAASDMSGASAASAATAAPDISDATMNPPAPSLATDLPPADATGLYGLAGLAAMFLAVTGAVDVLRFSTNRFVQTVLLPQFFRFGVSGEVLFFGLGLYISLAHVSHLRMKHKLLRVLYVLLMAACLYTQYVLHRLWWH